MYRVLLVPLDGSVFGEHALPYALSIARRAGAVIHLVHVHRPVPPLYVGGVSFSDSTDPEGRKHEEEYLTSVAGRLRASAAVQVRTALLDGPAALAIQEYATGVGADLIVLTTHGRGALSRFWLGSVADSLLRQATAPVLALRPPSGPVDLGHEPVFRHVLIPLDGSPLAEQVLEPALALGRTTDADYRLLEVIDPTLPAGYDLAGFPTSTNDPAMLEELRRKTELYLDRVAERLRTQGVRATGKVVFQSHTAAGILEQAAGVDLIALATHGHGGIRRLLLGSVADKLLRAAEVPVLVYRPKEA